MNKLLLLFYALLLSSLVMAQEAQPEGMRSANKIYVVLAVVLTILVGFFIYLIRVDNKISRLEKNNK